MTGSSQILSSYKSALHCTCFAGVSRCSLQFTSPAKPKVCSQCCTNHAGPCLQLCTTNRAGPCLQVCTALHLLCWCQPLQHACWQGEMASTLACFKRPPVERSLPKLLAPEKTFGEGTFFKFRTLYDGSFGRLRVRGFRAEDLVFRAPQTVSPNPEKPGCKPQSRSATSSLLKP